MKRQEALWIILWFLSVHVSASCLLNWCRRDKAAIREKILVKKPYLHDTTEFTQDQQDVINSVLKDYPKPAVSLITAFLWCCPTARELPVTQHIHPDLDLPGSIWLCQLSADNAYLVESTQYILSVWNVASGKQLWTQRAHPVINHASLSSTDDCIVSAGEEGCLKIWTFHTGDRRRTIQTNFPVRYCALSHNNQLLLSCSGESPPELWSVQTGQYLRSFSTYDMQPHSGYWAQFYRNDTRVAYVNNRKVILCPTEKSSGSYCSTRVLDYFFTLPITLCHFSTNEDQLLTAGDHGLRAQVWMVDSGERFPDFCGHSPQKVRAGCFVIEDTYVASIDELGTLCIWEARSATCKHRFVGAYCVHLLPHSYWLQSTDNECIILTPFLRNTDKIHILAVVTGTIERKFTIQGENYGITTVSSDGRYLFSSGSDCIIRMIPVFTK